MADIIIKANNEQEMFVRVIENLFLKRIRAGMPVFIALVGKSSSGKSAFGLLMQDIFYDLLGKDYSKFLLDTMLIKPDQYTSKIRKLLDGDKKFKHIKSLQTDEAKFILNSEAWMSFRSKAIRTITATSRAIKPMLFIIVAQLMRDIDKPTRLSLDYYFEVKRSPGSRPKIIPYVLYEDTSDPEKAKIRKRRLKVGVINSKGQRSEILPIFRPVMPRKKVWDVYKKDEVAAKKEEIFKLLDDLDKDIAKMSGTYSKKIEEFANYLIENPVELEKIGKINRGKFKIGADAKTKYNYTSSQMKQVEQLITENMEKVEDKEKEMLGGK